ncbi:MAG: pectate lyase [Phycisphaerales bacterium]|nr:pectate lyase [Phycisphaerales bacterium]
MTQNRFACTAAVTAVLASITLSSAADPSTQPATRTATKAAATKPAAKRPAPQPAVSERGGKLSYVTQPNGDRVPDFSYAGYAGSNRPIPTVPAKLLVGAPAEDNTRAIQAAINQAAKLPLDADGFRGAVLIPPGQYKVNGAVKISTSGVVLRGSGASENGTTLLATGTDRRTVIEIAGGAPADDSDATPIADSYVPVGAMQITVAKTGSIKGGDRIIIRRPSTENWIEAIGMDDLGGDRHGPSWKAGTRDVTWDRGVTKVEGNKLTLDAPLTLAIDANFGGAIVAKSNWPARITNVGVENLRIISTYNEKNPKDEEHAWLGVGINNAQDAWVRRVTFEHLAGSAVAVWESASRVTVEDCKSLQPVGEIGGLRRNSFFTTGQQVLMQRLHSEAGVHDFSVGFGAAGPNAFVQCESVRSLGESGPIDSIACGTLLDRIRIDGQPLSLRNRTYQGQGVGWASFNGVLWNCTSPVIECWQPPTAQNWSFGACGEFSGNGAWSGSNDDVNPASLFMTQLGERIGADRARQAVELNLPPVQGSRAPTLESAAEAIEISMTPRVDMAHWIDDVAQRSPLPIAADGVAKADRPQDLPTEQVAAKNIKIVNGWLTIDGRLITGHEMGVPWWNASVRGTEYTKASPALTRFVPGRTGTGLTDDLNQFVTGMLDRGQVSVWQHPPLWYERRRDDHERVQRMDGDVVAPFYETPWARSGIGRASDGLSKFDVTKPDVWYFSRLKQFADLASQNGLVLFSGLYMQHNILEAGAHYADAPWRPANNINPVGIPEPVFFAGDKLIYVAKQFYDVTNPDRRALHRTYMRNALNELGDKPNVIFFLSEEYTGPLEFTQFWLDTVAEWEAETGKHPLIALYAPKDVTDSILNDPKRAAVVSLIYHRFNNDDGWWYQPDGTLYAPRGGQNLSPRQWIRLEKPKYAGFDQVVRAVSEYRRKYPDKPFVYEGPSELAWAVLLGGGSLTSAPIDPALAAILPTMKPAPASEGVYGLADAEGKNMLIYDNGKSLSELVRQQGATFEARRVDSRSGKLSDWKDDTSADRRDILWLHKK